MAEPAIEAHGSGGRTLVDQPVEVVVVAGEQHVDDDVLVTLQVLCARPGLLGQPGGEPLAERPGALAQREHVGRRLGVPGGVPERAAGHERVAQRLPLALDPLGQERVAVCEARDRFGQRPVGARQESH